MCFHSKQSKSATELQHRFKATMDNPLEFQPQNHINGFDFPETPVIIDEKPQIITHYNWGLIPAWSKDSAIQKYTLNAKIETVNEKPSFKNSVNKRCLVIANGYFEWKWLDPKGKNKQKYEIELPNEELFAFAGLYAHWVDKNTGELKNTYTILTTEASPLLAEIHNHNKRMPIVLKHEDEKKWLQHEPIEHYAYPYSVDLVALKL
ncbi:SOS response-associated peptidase [Flavobacterium sp.]|uniref:SOS response-associated peptidase n=1 Tax=Flavobacterium sp. TaxID=239 RepID=UPI003751C282